LNWKQIAIISDKDFGFNTPKEKTNITRFGVRVLLFNERQEICVIKSEKYGYMQLPGGGIDEGESILEGLKRETREETGFLIKDIKPLGVTIEKREDIRNTHDFDQDISYIFTAALEKYVGTNYMDDEIAEGFKPIWIKLEDFITEQESNEGKIKNYSGCFSNRRDLEIARYYYYK
ncbi:NUDIX domain-containing protein, partial [Candidatus Saccharibacteria bacterium]|nr:NUDIX domain-containing protein [Candidatus Saccharibacteria bacterium]